MNRPTCETCPFWKLATNRPPVQTSPTTSVALGECRAHSVLAWPIRKADEWCGEHTDMKAWLGESRRCTETWADSGRSFHCSLPSGHAGVHEFVMDDRCNHVMLNHAYCVLPLGHAGPHEALGMFADEPARCGWVVGNDRGERCGREAGHGGKHVWDRGD